MKNTIPVKGKRVSQETAGLTMLDVMVAAVLLTVAVASLLNLIVSSMQLSRVNRETAVAYQTARQFTEEIQVDPFAQIFAIRSANPDFAVPGLNVQTGDGDGFVGQIQFPVVGGQLREDVNMPELGMPRDLNGDGFVDALDHSGDYVVLPVQVTLSWRGVSGNRTIDVATLLMDW